MTVNLVPDVLNARCPSRLLMNQVTSKWGVLVLLALQDGTQRYGELRRRIDGISERMLAQTLRTLEESGFLARDSHDTIPPRVDYALTPVGVGAAERVRDLAEFLEAHIGAEMEAGRIVIEVDGAEDRTS